ncbi:MFS transporter [Paenibacillus methanolicus]|uniref:DHA2 family metal-tetracycline-proton antiporter-like MFS transporter n=1 Tax=Paenibacillus methanolicus TaxID=582686 RepID=A0A5S5C4P9_9BACL|nr:MFS transporter [Paenibacillus methanolicus]TYP73396.1 DHA2 family metal-tetracycline-proton antiporter-like MFS transporter [Paenibacillus methanolicus]
MNQEETKRNEARQPGERLLRVLAFTLVISVMSATMFNIVLPDIREEFGLSLAQVSWVTSAFLLVYAVGTVIYGKLADIYKLKNLLTFGLLFFAFGSIIGLAAQTYGMVLLGRILQAAGAAVIPATAGIIPVRYFPPERRGRAFGIAMTGLAIGGAIGPVAASLLASAVHWRWLFCMPLLTLLTLPYYRRYLDDARGRAPAMDWAGAGLIAGTASLLLLAITNAAWLPGAGCLLLFVLFVARIRSAASPFIRPELFRHKSFALVLLMASLTSGIGYSLAFLSPQLLSDVHHLDTSMVGFAMFPAAAATALLGRKAGKLADAKGNAALFYVASTLLFICFLALSVLAARSSVYVALLLILGNVGQSFLMIAMSGMISRTLPQEQTGVGMGLLSMLNFISGAVASSLYGAAVDLGAGFAWNGIPADPAANVFSNIYLLLAILHVLILAFYYIQFGRAERKRKAASRRVMIR